MGAARFALSDARIACVQLSCTSCYLVVFVTWSPHNFSKSLFFLCTWVLGFAHLLVFWGKLLGFAFPLLGGRFSCRLLAPGGKGVITVVTANNHQRCCVLCARPAAEFSLCSRLILTATHEGGSAVPTVQMGNRGSERQRGDSCQGWHGHGAPGGAVLQPSSPGGCG